jgi:DNA helicase-2/ATP-dependent DNA helicase PcrA
VDEILFELLNRTRYLEHFPSPFSTPRDPRISRGPRIAGEVARSAGGGRTEQAQVIANVSRFADVVDRYCDRRRDHSLSLFVDYLDLVLLSGVDEEAAREHDLDDREDAVRVMTIHQAKGLEFEVVFLPAMVEGRLPQPHRSADLDLPPQLAETPLRAREDQVAEERRLCYVAMTRARSRLFLSWAEQYEGSRTWRPSRFLDELGSGVVQRTAPGVGQPPGPPPALRATSPREGGREEVTLSFSSIAAYRECPRQHWFRYRLRLPAAPAVEAQFGTILHLVLMRAGRLRGQGREVGGGLLRDLYQEAWESVGLTEPRRRPALEALGWRLLEGFHQAGGLDATPWLLEAPFTASVDGWSLRGIIDRVDEAPPRWRIIDYKTGRPQPESRLRRDLQLALYALGARSLPGIDAAEPLELEIVYLRDGHRRVLEATSELVEQARRIGDEVAEGVRAGRFEPRPDRRRCSLCAYRLACDASL